jgi:regulator of protease activity HflC (stomatin/prohibitin superfamily)
VERSLDALRKHFTPMSEETRQFFERTMAKLKLPPETERQLKAEERKRLEKLESELEQAAKEREAAKQARRARRKGVGGRHPVITPTEIEAARERLRQAIETEPKNRSLKFVYEGDFTVWWNEDPERKKREIPGRTTFRDNVFWPVCGKHHEKQRD